MKTYENQRTGVKIKVTSEIVGNDWKEIKSKTKRTVTKKVKDDG